jgi:STE24 endopeptidase
MRTCSVPALLFAILLLIPCAAQAATTATEAAAIAAAEKDHTAYTLTPDELAKSGALTKVRIALTFGSPIWSMICLFLILQLGIAPRMRNVAVNLSKNRWTQGFTFFFLFLLLTTLLGLPLDIYGQHVQNAYGLSVQNWGSWLGDQAKTFGLTFVFGGLGVILLFFLIRKFPRRWWLWLWFPTMAFVILGIFVTPYVIDPLFNKFEPLSQSNPALVSRLEQVVARGKGIEIPPERMFLMKASAKVTTLNAYVTGFGASKRVVVWDTSIAKGTPDEILFIFGHEMGHYVLGHIIRGIAFAFVLILISFLLGFYLFQFLLRKYGEGWGIRGQEDWASFVVFVLVLSAIGFFVTPIQSAFSRTQEHAADVYGEEVVHGVIADPQATGQPAFQLLGENSLTDPNPPAFVTFWEADHPPIWFRAAFAKHYDPWAEGAEPKYFEKK